MNALRGLGTALITPFKIDESVDYEALERLLNKQIEGNNVDYIVVLGTTGEAATLSEKEKAEVQAFIVSYTETHPSALTQKPLPLVLGVGGNCTAQVIQQLENNQSSLQHFSAILSVCPYYNKPSQEGLFQHFVAIAKASPIPVILYNVPGRTGVNLLPETVIRIYRALPEKIMGIKEASGNVEQIKSLIELSKGTSLLVISGDDGIAAEIIAAGGAGLISVASNAWPKEIGKLVHQADQAIQQDFSSIIPLLFKEGNPSGIKTVLSQMGLIENVLRLPLVPNSASVQEEIQKTIKSL